MKLKQLLFIVTLTSIACGCSKEPPKCSDPNTISLIRQIIISKLGEDHPAAKLGAKELENALSVTNSRASSYDEKVRKFSCEGTIVVPNKSSGKEYQANIEYESQLDDNKKHIVVLKNMLISDLGNISFLLKNNIKIDNVEKTPKNEANPTSKGTQEQFSYMQPVTLIGMLKSGEGFDANDKKAIYPALQLAAPITVVGNPKDDDETLRQTESDVVSIQLVLSEELMAKYKSLKGKNVKVSCSDLFSQINGNHFTKILCTTKEITQE